ncbi:MAG: AI-2E family transporter, partial [Caldilineaceae bacterium]|nr:AI-2E family transporter [Caldilineaceae bacterium]
AVLTTLTVAPEKSLWVIVALLLIQQAENNFLVPKIMDRSVGVHPLVTILAISAFGLLFGIVGAILAIPLAAILQILGRRLLVEPLLVDKELDEEKTSESNKRNRFSVLRLEAEELVQDVRKQARKRDGVEISEPHVEEAEDLIESAAENLQHYLLMREKAA